MEKSKYIASIRDKYSKYFDIENDADILGEKIDMYARFAMKNNRTILTKNDVIDSYETFEYCFIKTFDLIDIKDIRIFVEFLKNAGKKYITPNKNHMCSYITGIIVSNGSISADVKEYVQRFRQYKIYKLYLNGWSEIRLVLVDLDSNSVITNRSGKKVKKVYLPTP